MDTTSRKRDHLDLALKAQFVDHDRDQRFYYEPLFAVPPKNLSDYTSQMTFFGKTVYHPLFISSMTGGALTAFEVNSRLAQVCKVLGIGMGLGSCRPLLGQKSDSPLYKDFKMREFAGPNVPLLMNLGINQIEEMTWTKDLSNLVNVYHELQVDGLIIHLNLLQEWAQPEGDLLKYNASETLHRFSELWPYPWMVKEVGQGMGPKTLKQLLQLPISAIELAGLGGTNFTKLENMRNVGRGFQNTPFEEIGHTCLEMLSFIKGTDLWGKTPIIVSGGIKSALDAYYLLAHAPKNSFYALASRALPAALTSLEELQRFVEGELLHFYFAKSILHVKLNW